MGDPFGKPNSVNPIVILFVICYAEPPVLLPALPPELVVANS
jgi:hypothetical protein